MSARTFDWHHDRCPAGLTGWHHASQPQGVLPQRLVEPQKEESPRTDRWLCPTWLSSGFNLSNRYLRCKDTCSEHVQLLTAFSWGRLSTALVVPRAGPAGDGGMRRCSTSHHSKRLLSP